MRVSGERRVVVCGAGLAAEAVVTALSARLGPEREVVFVDGGAAPASDLFYGTAAGPDAGAFHDQVGLTEAALLMSTNASFSWGTRYAGWGGRGRSWTQCHHLPLQDVDGVGLQHFLTRLGDVPLDALLVTARAAERGVFAHPPGPPDTPLSRAEYGYQFDPFGLSGAFRSAREAGRVRHVEAAIDGVETGDDGVAAIVLSTGERLTGGLYVDATGPDALLLSRLGASRRGRGVSVRLTSRLTRTQALGPPRRDLRAAPCGWTSTTYLRTGPLEVALSCVDEAGDAHPPDRAATAVLGRVEAPWVGNCVGVGHAASVVDPLTTAPLTLLYRDVQRLLSLVPLGADHAVERREYARRFGEDAAHAAAFHGAFFELPDAPDTPYWRAGRAAGGARRAHKLAQYEGRGVLVSYDLEPYKAEDWLILHEGVGRTPRRYDRLTDRAPEAAVRARFEGLRRGIEALVSRMPPHDRYVARYLDYLERKG